MKKMAIIFFSLALFMSCDSRNSNSKNDLSNDKSRINQSINDWDKAWESKDLELALKHYADQTDWTNAFGDRVQSKEELRELLKFIFNMNFVMEGENNYGENEITFINDNTATVRSQNIRKNQKWADGSKMDDRYINHLRVYQKNYDVWLITNHMISQAHPKGNNEKASAEEIKILDSYFDGLRSGEIDSIPMTEDVSFLGPSVPETILGRELVAEHLSNVARRFIGSEFIIKEHCINGNSAYSYFDIVMNNGELVVPIIDYFEFEDGKIKKIRPYFDPRPFIKEFERRRNEK